MQFDLSWCSRVNTFLNERKIDLTIFRHLRDLRQEDANTIPRPVYFSISRPARCKQTQSELMLSAVVVIDF